jgi:glutaconate CoA-transferase subunit A
MRVMYERRAGRKKAEILALEEAVKKYMHDGIMFSTGGFTAMNRRPCAWAWETVRQGIKNIHYIDAHGSVISFLLSAAKAMKFYETSWIGWAEMGGKMDMNEVRQYMSGDLICEDHAHGAMATRFLAGAIGVPFLPYYAPPGSDIYNPNYDAIGRAGLRDSKNPRIAKKKFLAMDDPFFGEGKVYLLPAARPELSVIHVAQAGEKGTARWKGLASLDKEIAFAGSKVVLTCEEIVSEDEIRREPEANQIPSFIVDCIVEVPYGAYPTAVPSYYDYDFPFLLEMNQAARSEDEMKRWLDQCVYGPKNWNDLLAKVGIERLLNLRVDKQLGYSMRIKRGREAAPKLGMPLSVRRAGY